MSFKIAPSIIDFGNVIKDTTARTNATVSNNYILPTSDALTVTSPFAIDGSLTKNVEHNFILDENIVPLSITPYYYKGGIGFIVMYNDNSKLMMKKVGVTGGVVTVEVDASEADFAVGTLYFYTNTYSSFVIIYSQGSNLYYIGYTNGTLETKQSLSVSGGTFTEITQFDDVYIRKSSHSTSSTIVYNIVIAINDDSDLLISIALWSDGTNGSIVASYVVDDTVFFTDANKITNLNEVIFDSENIFTINVLAISGLYLINHVSEYNPDVFVELNSDSDFTYIGDIKEDNDRFYISGVKAWEFDTLLVKSFYRRKSIWQNTYIEYELGTFSSGVLNNVVVSVASFTDLTIEFGSYNGVWVSHGTVSVTNGDNIYKVQEALRGSQELGTHIRIINGSSYFGLAWLSIMVGSNTYLFIDGWNVLTGSLVSSSLGNYFIGYVPCEELKSFEKQTGVSGDVLLDNLVTSEGVVASNFHNTYYDFFLSDFPSGVSTDTDIFRRLLVDEDFEQTTAYHYLFEKFNDEYYVGFYITNHTIIVKLDSNFDIDDTDTVEVSVTPTSYGAFKSDIINNSSDDIGDLYVNCYAVETTSETPFALALFGEQHKDFHRKDVLPVSKSVYVYSKNGTGDTYSYNAETCQFTLDSNGTYYRSEISSYLQDVSNTFKAFVDTANIVFDQINGTYSINASAIKILTTLSVSKHPTVISWALDSNYVVDEYEGWYSTGELEETGDMSNTGDVHISGTKQVVIREIAVDDRSSSSIKLRITVGDIDENGEFVYDDYRVLFIQVIDADSKGIGGDNV